MVFSSTIFIFFFLPAALLLYYVVPARLKSLRNGLLIISSLVFYTWGELYNVFLLIFLCFSNYFLGVLLGYLKSKKALLAVGVVFNLSFLFYYKYSVWAVAMLLSIWGSKPDFIPPALPLGISFFTFHAISYLVDIYRKDISPARTVWNFSCYFVMFPHLVAGPIVRYAHISKDLDEKRNDFDLLYAGIKRFILGLAKKMLIANQVAFVADAVFALPPSELGMGTAWLGALAYSLQIYFDFSAYSDMAIGLAAMFGFRFHENFAQPYSAISIQDFWRKWHISLSTWLRDYLYIPLGGSRGGEMMTYRNLLLVFFFCGLWHGANWTFIIWGLYHGFFLIMERLFLNKFLVKIKFLSHIYVVTVFMCGWVIFRAESVQQIGIFFKAMFIPGERGLPVQLAAQLSTTFWIALCAGIIGATGIPFRLWKKYNASFTHGVKLFLWEQGSVIVLGVMLVLSTLLLLSGTYNPFIYYRF